MKKTITDIIHMKESGEKIACLTAYDYSFAKLLSSNNVDIILTGDSLGMVVQGNENTVSVTLDHMVYHTTLVKKGAAPSLLMADIPFLQHSTIDLAVQSATKLMQAGADIVKLEGGQWLSDTVKFLYERGVPVCGHLGLTPQSVSLLGGFKMQGKANGDAERMLDDALALEAAGIQLLVLECIPAQLANTITQAVRIPTIGIGAGVHTDGQILVTHDILDICVNKKPKFAKNFMSCSNNMEKSIQNYVKEVKKGVFPQQEHTYA